MNCTPYSGDYSTVTIHFVNEHDEDIANSIVMTNRVGQKYTTPKIAGVYGYRLDLENLPENGAGKYTKDPITVTYRYESIEVSAEEGQVDPDALDNIACVANIIYMNSKGEILDKKTYVGDKDTDVVVEYIDIPGYVFISDTSEGAVFTSVETNIVVNYDKQTNVLNIALIAGGAVLLLLLAAGIVLLVKKGKSGVGADGDSDDLFIE